METKKEAKGVKETIEFINGGAEVAIFVKKVGADGKVDVKDVPHLVELAKKHEVLVAAVKDANEITAELKDLTAEELQQIGAAAVQAYSRFKEA